MMIPKKAIHYLKKEERKRVKNHKKKMKKNKVQKAAEKYVVQLNVPLYLLEFL